MESNWETRFKALEESHIDLKKRYKDLEFIVQQLVKQNNLQLEQANQESFYQKYLETKYNASHTTNTFGTTDIETDDAIIEIKNWKNYKALLGQILSYTRGVNKQKIAYFFGKKPGKLNDILGLMKSHDITVYHITMDANGNIEEENLLEVQTEFMKWLDQYIVYQKDNVLELSKACQMFEGRLLGTKVMKTYKAEIEHFISLKFPNVNHKYQNTTINGTSYRGWLNLSLLNK